MDRVSKIGIVVCVLLLIGWFFHQKKQSEQAVPSRSEGTITISGAPSPGLTPPPATPAPVPDPEPAAEKKKTAGIEFTSGEDGAKPVETDLLSVRLSAEGGVVREVVLRENLAAGIRGLGKENGDIALFRTDSPLSSLGWLGNITCLEMRVEEEGLIRRFSGTSRDGTFSVVKNYSFRPDSYLADLEIEVTNVSPEAVSLNSGIDLVCGTMHPIDPGDSLGVDVMTPHEVQRKMDPGPETAAHVDWLALKTKYFAGIVKPVDEAGTGYRIKGRELEPAAEKAAFGCSRGAAASRYQYLSASMGFDDLNLGPGEKKVYKFVLYLGPANYDLLAAEGFGFEEVIDLGLLSPVCKAIIWLLNRLYGLIGSYGWAIILLTLIVKVVLWPLTHKSYKSMKEMQKLQPKIKELKEKCKGDNKKLQEATMKLYKEHGVNPMSGCLPMLLQMPILFALFTALRNTILLRNAPFWIIPGKWIQNLSGPDHLATLPRSFPIIGNQVNILPLLMGLTFYLQQKFTPQAPAASDQAAQQQKMMATLMPALFTLMFYTLPSGLNLYFTLSTIITIVQQGAIARKSA